MALTILSILVFSYTMYLIFETSKAVRSLTASISAIRTEENASEAYFSITIYNPSEIPLGLYSYRVIAYFDNNYIDEKQSYSYQPLQLPGNTAKNLSVTISLNNQTIYPDGSWRLNTRFKFQTPLPGDITFHTVLER